MNNKGQVLIFFILIIPLLLIGVAYITDNIYIAYHTNQLNQINSLVIKDTEIQNLNTETVEEYIKKNDSTIEVEFVFVSSEKIEIILKKEIKSLFGSIIGKKSYTLTSKKSVDITNKDLPLYQ